ncbi:MAG: spinster family MFS transporter [Cyclonatronaceae bacterium]
MFRKYSFWLLILLLSVYVLSFVDRQIIGVLATQIRADLNLSNTQIGLLYGTAFSFIYAFAGIPMGRLADRWSRRKVIAIALFSWSLATVASGFATSFAMLVLMRLLLGVSQAMLSPAAYAILAETFPPEKRGTVFSIYASGIFIGIGASFLVGGTVANSYDWQTAMIVVGLPGLFFAPLVWLFVRDARRSPADKAQVGFFKGFLGDTLAQLSYMLGKKTVWLHLTGFAALSCIGYTVLAFASTILGEVYQRPDLIPHYGWFQLGVAGSVIMMGRLADSLALRNKARRFWAGIIPAAGAVPFYALGLFASDGFSGFIFLGIAVLFSSSYNGVAAALIQFMVKPEMRALAGGLYLFVISVAGFGFGPPLAGFLMDHVFSGPLAPSKALMSIIAVCAAVAVTAFTFAMKTYEGDSES